jgi:hypothetical protein
VVESVQTVVDFAGAMQLYAGVKAGAVRESHAYGATLSGRIPRYPDRPAQSTEVATGVGQRVAGERSCIAG